MIEATGLRTRENVLRWIDPAIAEQAHQNDADPAAATESADLASAARLLSLRPHKQAAQAHCPLGTGLLAHRTARLSQCAGTATAEG